MSSIGLIRSPRTLSFFQVGLLLVSLTTSLSEAKLKCPAGFFPCDDGSQCLAEIQKCDLVPDCPDGSDEPPDCEFQPKSHLVLECNLPSNFQCKITKKCILKDWTCDGELDCGRFNNVTDISDEDPFLCASQVNHCKDNFFRCKDNRQCIEFSKFCDHVIDCKDNSDEGSFCKKKSVCSKAGCSDLCALTWNGPRCYCPPGKTPSKMDPHVCVDQDQCEIPGSCDQKCTSFHNGTFVCSCLDGYVLEQGKRCKAVNVPLKESASLIFANSVNVQQIGLDGKVLGLVNTSEALTLDFDHRNRSMCWLAHKVKTQATRAERILSRMKCAKIDNLEKEQWTLPELDTYSLKSISQITYDWTSRNWYLIDDVRETIIICSLKEIAFICKSIISTNISKPRGLALDPNHDVMFFTVWGSSPARLERSAMDGTNRKVIVDTSIAYPYGVAVDYANKKVYWVDTYLDNVERVDYDGANREMVVKGTSVHNVYSISLFERSLFVSSWRENAILHFDKFHPILLTNGTTLISELQRPFGVKVFHRQRQPISSDPNEHACTRLSPCQHFCLPTKEAPFFRCLCKEGFQLSSSMPGRCSKIDETQYLLYMQERPTSVRGFSMHNKSLTDSVIMPIVDLERPTAFASVGVRNHLYIADSSKHVIVRHNLELGESEVFIKSGINFVTDLALDPVAKNIYWADEGLEALFVASIVDVKAKKRLFEEDVKKPLSLALDFAKGYLYYSTGSEMPLFNRSRNGKIFKTWMDGSNRAVLVEKNLIFPSSLTVYPDGTRLFWCDSQLQRIESISLISSNLDRKIHVSASKKHPIRYPSGLAVDTEFIYWSEPGQGRILRQNLGSEQIEIFKSNIPRVFGLEIVDTKQEFDTSHPCNNGACTDLCLLNPVGRTCACRDGTEEVNQNCQSKDEWKPVSKCRDDMEFQCVNSTECISKSFLCDGNMDCVDGSDEDFENLCANITCQENQIKCDSSRCISELWRCDGEIDCEDGTDEQNCEELNCKKDNVFVCKYSKKCIPQSWVCDSELDCGPGDASDEHDQCVYERCNPMDFVCDNLRCIVPELVCNGHDDCLDFSDEKNCQELCDEQDRHYCQSEDKCISLSKLCDGVKDCSDGSDEESCKNALSYGGPRCNKQHEFACDDGSCIPKEFQCDLVFDCLDKSDEIQCVEKQQMPSCSESGTSKCQDGSKCIPTNAKCDGKFDCPDKSDEKNCEAFLSVANCSYPSLSCDKKCVSVTKLCDGVMDCPNGEDEGGQCEEEICSNGINDCSDFCRNSPDGRRCFCRPGMELKPPLYTECVDSYSCGQWGSCSQLCKQMSRRRHKCHCQEGFVLLDDEFSCKSKDPTPPLLVYNTRNEIRTINLRSSLSQPLIFNLKDISSIEFMFQDRKLIIFWSDAIEGKIYRGIKIGSTLSSIQEVATGYQKVESMAVDPLSENLYWLDNTLGSISVINLHTKFVKTLIDQDLFSSRGLTIDTLKTTSLFWINRMHERSQIETSDLSGNNRKVLFVADEEAWITSLNIDPEFERLIFIDSRSQSIRTIKPDGSDLLTIIQNEKYLSYAGGVASFESNLFWTDVRSMSVIISNKWNETTVVPFERTATRPLKLKVAHPLKHPNLPKSHHLLACRTSNGNCSHLCLLNALGPTCACPDFMSLSTKDNKTCIVEENLIIFTEKDEVKILNHPSWSTKLNEPLLGSNMAYDKNSQALFWLSRSDSKTKLHRTLLNGTRSTKVILDRAMVNTEAFALDWISGKIFFASSLHENFGKFLKDLKDSSIYACDQDGMFIALVVDRAPGIIKNLVVAPKEGLIFWTDELDDKISLKTSLIDGTKAEELKTYGFKESSKRIINYLSFSSSSQELVWYDKKESKIKVLNIISKKMKMISRGDMISAMNLANGNVYFAIKGSLEWMNITTLTETEGKRRLGSRQSHVQALLVETENAENVSNPCKIDNGGCEHLCLPLGPQATSCMCSLGFRLFNKTACVANPRDMILMTSDLGISGLTAYSNGSRLLIKPLADKNTPVSIATFPRDHLLFWLDQSARTVYRMNRVGTNVTKILTDLQSPQQIAVDRISKLLFWTDNLVNTIELSDFDGKKRYVVIANGLEKPYAIVIDSEAGLMFWSDVGIVPRIETSGLDGSKRKTLVNSNLKFPRSLALDTIKKKIFWCDPESGLLETIGYDGSGRRVLLESENHRVMNPKSVLFYDGKLVWLDSKKLGGSIWAMQEKHQPQAIHARLSRNGPLDALTLYTSEYDGEDVTTKNPCFGENNGGCQDICLFNGESSSCICAYGKLRSDLKGCEDHEDFLLFSRVSRLEGVFLYNESDPNPPMAPIKSDSLKNVVGIASAFDLKLIIYSDIERGTINSVQFDGKNHKVLLKDVGIIEGLAFEASSNTIFWTSSSEGSVKKAILDPFSTTQLNPEVVVFLGPDAKPRGIDISVCDRRLYFANWDSASPSIQRVWETGYGLESVITTEIRMPNAIAVDADAKIFFWGDARLDKIERVEMESLKRVVLSKTKPQHPFDMAVHGDHLFFSDWVLHQIVRVNKYTGEDQQAIKTDIPRPLSITIVSRERRKCHEDPCAILNGGCEDLCVVDDTNQRTCKCFPGRYPLNGDLSRCISKPLQCPSENDFHCNTDNSNKFPSCIAFELTCDGIAHCGDGSDEDREYCAKRLCKSGFYRCANNRCIDESKLCNNVNDCGDFSDEKTCPCEQDDPDLFKCLMGPCIERSKKCNQIPDCPHADDEMNCPKVMCTSSTSPGKAKNVSNSKIMNCARTTACILSEWICDGENDCWDNSDEAECATTHLSRNQGEEVRQNGSECEKDSFQCRDDSLCIPEEWVCDGKNDCHDELEGESESSDELNCHPPICPHDKFQCANGDCIPKDWVCDQTPDCSDGSDEPETCSVHNCDNELEFLCSQSKKCIPKSWVCDGDYDCSSDEKSEDESPSMCQKFKHKCSSNEFRCLSGQCIASQFYCDHDTDCPDGSDEPETCDYNHCPVNFLRCANGLGCVPMRKLCDNEYDCHDKSDEDKETCRKYRVVANSTFFNSESECASRNQFECANKACVDFALLCNGQDDCGDFSDEKSCNVNECIDPLSCAHICIDRKIGYECKCHSGFQVRASDPSLCDDIDECTTNKPCSHFCANKPGSFECSCHKDYLPLHNAQECKANSSVKPKLLYTNRYYIKLSNPLGISDILIKNQSRAVAMDYDWDTRCIFWSDITLKGSSIRKSCKANGNDSSANETELQIQHLATARNPDGLAVDWVGKNLYWCDKGSDTIEVSNFEGRYRRILIREGLTEPRGIVVAPLDGLLFWSDWGSSPHIGRASMDGSNPTVIVSRRLGWPNALTIDYVTRELFYGDAKEDYIAVTDFDGSNIRVVLSLGMNPAAKLHHIFAISVFESELYWSDWETRSIEKCHKYSGKDSITLLESVHRTMDVKVFHPMRQPKPEINPCLNNGGCDSLCLLRPGNMTGFPTKICECPENFVLASDGLSCEGNCSQSQFMCLSTLKCIPFWWKCDGQDDCGDLSDEPPDCREFKCIVGQFQCNNSNCISPTNICDGINDCGDNSDEENCNEYDCLERQFKCPKTSYKNSFCISVARKCDGKADCPGAEDEMNCSDVKCPDNHFRCDETECMPNVFKCNGERECQDGSDEPQNCSTRQCPNQEFRCSNGRCIPMKWRCDGEEDCPNGEDEPDECSDEDYHQCRPSEFRCKNNQCIPGRWECDFEEDCRDGSDEINCEGKYRSCSEDETHCLDGFCVLKSQICDGVVHCKDKSDELHCNVECGKDEFKCAFPPICIFNQWKCDGEPDCPDGSDELQCETFSCPLGQTPCGASFNKSVSPLSGPTCINSHWLCNDEPDCPDGSDEDPAFCVTRSCEPGRYRCDNHKCIAGSEVCDGQPDCSDASDETQAACETVPPCGQLDRFRCGNGKCLSRDQVCNGVDDCADNSDESICEVEPCLFGVCSQICEAIESRKPVENESSNTLARKKVYCSCVNGYVPETKKTCVAEDGNATLLVANADILRHVDPYALTETVNLDHPEDKTKRNKIGHVDAFFDEEANPIIVWSVPTQHTIYFHKISPNQEETLEDDIGVLTSDVVELRALAVDWVVKMVYFIDGVLVFAKGFKDQESVQFDISLQNPQDIVVNPAGGNMFIAESSWNAKIIVASLDGSESKTLVSSNILWPSNLAIDYPSKRLYWTDLKLRSIETIGLDGKVRKTIRSFSRLEGRPHKIEVFEDSLYFSFFKSHRIAKMNKFGNGNVTKIVKEVGLIGDLVILQKNKQSKTIRNPCSKKNACSELSNSKCVLSSRSDYSCVCSMSYIKSGKKCKKDDSFIKQRILKAKNLEDECESLNCHTGECQMINSKPTCVCTNPLYSGEFCDKFICAGYCLNGGQCVPLIHQNKYRNDTSYNSTVLSLECLCKDGFVGARCQRLLENKCSCRNGGHCNSHNLTCNCPDNYTGSDCEICKGEQLSCENGGYCTLDTTSGQPRCVCPAGFEGARCEVSECQCQNGGTCFTTDSKRTCICPPEFRGSKCELYLCTDYCLNGGVAVVQGDGQCACDCKPDTSGERCEITTCSELVCANGAVCKLVDGQEVCLCKGPYGGPTCDKKLDVKNNPCDHVACQNGGVCTVLDDGRHKCVCPKQRSGMLCEKPNLCYNYCSNGGTCVWTTDSTVWCHCANGFKGSRCELIGTEDEDKLSSDGFSSDSFAGVLSILFLIFIVSVVGILFYVCIVRYRNQGGPNMAFLLKRRRTQEYLMNAESMMDLGPTSSSGQRFTPLATDERHDEEEQNQSFNSSRFASTSVPVFMNPAYEKLTEEDHHEDHCHHDEDQVELLIPLDDDDDDDNNDEKGISKA